MQKYFLLEKFDGRQEITIMSQLQMDLDACLGWHQQSGRILNIPNYVKCDSESSTKIIKSKGFKSVRSKYEQ